MATLETTSDNRLRLRCSYDERDLAKQIPGWSWNNEDKAWYYPSSEERIAQFKQLFPNSDVNTTAIQEKKEYTEHEKKLIELKQLKTYDIKLPALKAELMEHQKSGINYLLNLDAAMLADQMGIGKSFQAIVVSLLRKSRNEIKKTLIICPATAKYTVWEKEIKKFTDEKYLVVDGVKKKREEIYHTFLERDDIPFLIVNYESLVTDGKHLIHFPFESLIISDESIYIKNRTAQRTKAVKKIKSKYKIAISGYPIANRIIDIHSQYDWLIPGLLGSFYNFQDHYIDEMSIKKHHTEETKRTGKTCKCKHCGKWSPEQKYAPIYTCHCSVPEWAEPEFKKFLGYKNLDELKFKLEPYYIRRLKKDVLKDLPDKIYEQREVCLSGTLLKAYNDMKEEMRILIRNMSNEEVVAKAQGIMVQMLRLSQLTCGFISDKNLDQPVFYKENPKLDLLDDIVDEVLSNDDKIVIWTRFRPFMAHVFKHYSEGYKHDGEIKKHKCAFLWGGMTPKAKAEQQQMFQNDPDCKIFVGTVQTGGIAIDLYAASTEVFTDLSFLSPSTIEQATDRLHRKGQKKSVVVIDAIAKKTVDEHWIKILGNKQQVSGMIFEDDGIIRINNKETLLELLK